MNVRTSVALGAATRMSKQRERIGAMSLLVLFAQRMRRMLDMYFSIVRRSAACASRVSESASWITTTVQAVTTDELVNAGGRNEGGVRHTFEPLLRTKVHLLRLRDLLEDLLDDDLVVVPDFTGVHGSAAAPWVGRERPGRTWE